MKESLAHLLRTFSWEFTEGTRSWGVTEPIAATAGAMFASAFLRQYGDEEDDLRLRISALGYPAIYQVPLLFGYGKTEKMTAKQLLTFMRGELLEIYIYGLLLAYDNKVTIQHNPEVTFEGYAGHPDLVIEWNGERTVIECKSVSKHYAMSFVVRPDDERGYLSQLLIYMHVLGVDVGYFMMQVEESKELYLIQVNINDYRSVLDVALKRFGHLKHIHEDGLTLEEALDSTPIPPPVPAFIRNETYAFPTPPRTLRYFPHTDCLYVLAPVQGSTRLEVIRPKTTTEIIECLQTKHQKTSTPMTSTDLDLS